MSDAAAPRAPDVVVATRTTGAQTVLASPDATVFHLLGPKLLTARGRSSVRTGGRATRLGVLAAIGLLFWALVIGVLVRVLSYFRSVPEIGALLSGKLLGLVFVSFFSILMLSNIITALSSFFLARDLDLLVSAPVDWLQLYLAKLAETLVHSSWMVTLMAVPILGAYGYVYGGGAGYVLVAVLSFVPFLMIPAAAGSAITLLLVNLFPARRTRDILSVVTVLAGAGLVLLIRLMRPEKLARPEGIRSLVDFIALLRAPSSPFLPSDWVQRTVMSALTGSLDPLPLYLLWTTAATLVVVGAILHSRLYDPGFTKAQESPRREIHGRAGWERVLAQLLTPLDTLRRELVGKEVRVFFRDTTQWSQLILLSVLVVVYVFNVKFLPLRGEGITFFLVNVVPFLNLLLAGFVLASIAARFIFPGVSVEGRTLWLLKSSPMPMRALLWAKFWTGTVPLLVLALGIVVVTDVLLQVSEFMMVVSIFSITFLTFAIAGLAIGIGTLFPQFQTENAAQIPTSFGGLIFMISAVALIGGVVVLEARPVYMYLSARSLDLGPADPRDMFLGFGLALLLCVAATLVPITIAAQRLDAVEL